MTAKVLFALIALLFSLLLPQMADHMKNRPVEVKLGYLPHPQVLKAMVADQGPLVAEFAVAKVLFYFGTIIDKLRDNVIVRPEFYNMYKTIQTATQLDPYNEDAYYFAQAAFNWEVGHPRDVNHLLEYGMSYRTWDHWLPFYVGFNYAYFLKDYERGAYYMQRAAEISGNPLFANLAARYLYESNQTELGLMFLDAMIASTNDETVKKTFEIRREALLAVSQLERAVSSYREEKAQLPRNLSELVASGYVDRIPSDPYGGTFFLDPDGKIRSTSKFANPNFLK